MTQHANTPTHEPFDTLLSREQQASVEVRKAAVTARWEGVPLELALAEVRWAYEHVKGTR